MEQATNNVLKVKDFAQSIPNLFSSLTSASSNLLTKVREFVHPGPTDDILELISEFINEDAIYAKTPLELRNQRTFAVKV